VPRKFVLHPKSEQWVRVTRKFLDSFLLAVEPLVFNQNTIKMSKRTVDHKVQKEQKNCGHLLNTNPK